jgi:hypothetical protein
MTDQQNPEPMSREWNYHPDLPLANPSIFQWPPSPGFLARWFMRNWLMLSERVMMVLLAVACWLWLYPSLEVTQTLALGWIVQGLAGEHGPDDSQRWRASLVFLHAQRARQPAEI